MFISGNHDHYDQKGTEEKETPKKIRERNVSFVLELPTTTTPSLSPSPPLPLSSLLSPTMKSQLIRGEGGEEESNDNNYFSPTSSYSSLSPPPSMEFINQQKLKQYPPTPLIQQFQPQQQNLYHSSNNLFPGEEDDDDDDDEEYDDDRNNNIFSNDGIGTTDSGSFSQDEGIPLIIRTPSKQSSSFDGITSVSSSNNFNHFIDRVCETGPLQQVVDADRIREVLQRIEYEVIDHLEDEVDAHAYEVVPLEVKLALEEKVFGWSHIASIILGHVVFTSVAFLIPYIFLTNIYYYYLEEEFAATAVTATTTDLQTQHPPLLSIMSSSITYAPCPWWYQLFRFVASFFVALTVFRMVRRRSFIWFRAPYGSEAYAKDHVRRRQEVKETDKKTILGRIGRSRNLLLERRVQKKLNKATKLFEKARQKRIFLSKNKHNHKKDKKENQKQQLLQKEQDCVSIDDDDCDNDALLFHSDGQNSIDQTDSNDRKQQQQQQQQLKSPRSINITHHEHYDSFSNSTTHSNGSIGVTVSDTVSSSGSHTEDDDSDDEEKRGNNSDDNMSATNIFHHNNDGVDDDDENDSSNGCNRTISSGCTSYYTVPTKQMESIMHDQILFKCGPIKNMPYAHGGFFGAAPFMLANPFWISILRHLMPDVYVEISRRVATVDAPKLIHWAENNPVVAAFGTAHEILQHQFDDDHHNSSSSNNNKMNNPPNLEWDVFLDPALVARVEKVLTERRKFILKQKKQPHLPSHEQKQQQDQQQKDKKRDKQTMKYIDDQLKKSTQTLVDQMLIAHGNMTQLMLEQTGMLKRYVFSRVKRSRCTLGGGIYARQWMAVYAEALRLGVYGINDHDYDDDFAAAYSGNSINDLHHHHGSFPSRHFHNYNKQKTSLKGLAESKCPNTTLSGSVNILKSIFEIGHNNNNEERRSPIGLILDLKSRQVPKPIWALVVDTLRSSGIRIEGVASFTIDEIRDISYYCQSKPPVNEIIFFHSAGDLQTACHNKEIQHGDKIFFNAGSLLWNGKDSIENNDAIQEGQSNQQLQTGTAGRLISSHPSLSSFDPSEVKEKYKLLSYARPYSSSSSLKGQQDMGSTVDLYKKKYNLSIGLYCQEFAIDDCAINIIVKFVNDECPNIYNLGFSWGGINGITVNGIQPGRFTRTDGYWNQRYVGKLWDSTLYPPSPSYNHKSDKSNDSQ